MLRDLESLHRSRVVANSTMNRERRLAGNNSYARDLHLNVLTFLRGRLQGGTAAWVDLCCGTGRALVEAAATLAAEPGDVRIEGVDLVGLFDPNPVPQVLTFREGSVETWEPSGRYELVTCVHGLHYVGDKLAVIAKAAGCLAPGGLLVANLDLANFCGPDGRPAGRQVAAVLRKCGIEYDARRRLVRADGPRDLVTHLRYLGADDEAGPNYTGQPAVASYYCGLF